MKKIFFYSLLIFTISGCAGRQSSTSKTKEIKETASQEDVKVSQKTQQNTDSSGSSKTSDQGSGSSKTNTAGWKYTAPAQSNSCPPETVLTVFIKTPSGDSIDITKLPQGSVLESLTESSESSYNYIKTIDEQYRIIKDLRQDLEEERSKKAKEKIVEVEKLKEVEKQTIQWYLVGAALILGTFLPSIIKGAFNLLKKHLKPL